MAQAAAVQEIFERIQFLEQEASNRRSERDAHVEEAKKWAEKRNELNAEFKKLNDGIKPLREKRDRLNEKVKELKNERDQLRAKLGEKRAELEKLEDQLESLQSHVSGSYTEIKKEIEALEWRIQTNPLKPKDEHRLIAQIKQLEAQLPAHEKIREIRQKMNSLKVEMNAIRLGAEQIHQKLTDFAKESETYHKQMTDLMKPAGEFRARADEAHKNFLDFRTKADWAHQEFISNMVEIKQLRQQVHQVENEARSKKEEEILRKTEESATEKLKRGEKLSFEEFKTLIEKGKI